MKTIWVSAYIAPVHFLVPMDVCAQCTVDVELHELAAKLNEISLAVRRCQLSISIGVAQVFKGHTTVAVNVGRYGSWGPGTDPCNIGAADI